MPAQNDIFIAKKKKKKKNWAHCDGSLQNWAHCNDQRDDKNMNGIHIFQFHEKMMNVMTKKVLGIEKCAFI